MDTQTLVNAQIFCDDEKQENSSQIVTHRKYNENK